MTKLTKTRCPQSFCQADNERDRSNFVNKLSETNSPCQFYKTFRTFKSTCAPTSIFYRNEIASDSNSQNDLFCEFFAFIFGVYADLIQMEECISEKFLLDFNVSEKQIQHISANLETEKTTGHDELPDILFRRHARLSANRWSNYLTKLK